MTLPNVDGEFRVASEPEIKFGTSGTAYTRFRAVANSRKQDQNGQWVDDKTCWVNVTCFKNYAEHVAEHVQKGDIVILRGTLETRDYEVEGVKRVSVDIAANYVGLSLAQAISNTGGGTQGAAAQPAQDPWGAPAPTEDQPPF